ncbi:MAG TPA: hypothetical protein PLQ85_01460, partial [Anaerolineae bacterium]|nr:hypothetical protein [Anaerolineae bacterium]
MRQKNALYRLSGFLCLALLAACGTSHRDITPLSPPPSPYPLIFEGETAFGWVQRQCDLGA